MYRQSEKMLNSNIFSRCHHNMANFGPLTAEICSGVWAPQQISMGFESWLRYCSDVAQRRPTKLCTLFGRLLGTFAGGSCPLAEFCQLQNSLCVQVLRSHILAALLHGTSSGCQPYFAALNRGRHLYSAGRPSRWALAHILVSIYLSSIFFFPRLISAATDWISTILLHMAWP